MGMAASQARLMSLTARLSDLEFKAQAIQNDKIRLADLGEAASNKYSKALDKEILRVYNSKNSAYTEATVKNLVSYTNKLDIEGTNSKYRYMETNSGKLLATQSLYNDIFSTDASGKTITKDKDAFIGTYITGSGDKGSFTEDDMKKQSYQYYSDIYDKMTKGNYEIISDENATNAEYLTQQIQFGNISLYEYRDNVGTEGTGGYTDVTWNSSDPTLDMDQDKTEIAKAEAEYDTTMASIQSRDKRFDLELTQINTEHTAIQTEIDSVKKTIDKNIERSFKIFEA